MDMFQSFEQQTCKFVVLLSSATIPLLILFSAVCGNPRQMGSSLQVLFWLVSMGSQTLECVAQ